MTSLYIHIPFCIRKCAYCDFVSFAGTDERKTHYTDLLCAEIIMCAQRYRDRKISTVFIGGGTPSCMPYGEISRIMHTVFSCFDIDTDAEITIECNPGTVDEQKLTEYSSSGINRISFGLQSTHNRILQGIGRIHTFEDFLHSLDLVRKCGFTNINADIMYGLPDQSAEDFISTVKTVAELPLTHISAYSLILEEGTPLYSGVKSDHVTLPGEDEEYAMHRAAVELLPKAGFSRYEISNYAKEGFECRHNLCYWNVGEYIGAGLNSHSCIFENGEQIRHENTAHIAEYERKVEECALPVKAEEKICGQERMNEYIMLGTRKTEGISLSEFRMRFGKSFTDVYGERLAGINKEYYTITDRFYFTDKGLDVQNTLLCELL